MRHRNLSGFLAALALGGCGGGGAGTPDSGGGDGNQVHLGPLSASTAGAIKEPVVISGRNAVVMGLFGGAISNVRVKLPPMTQANSAQILAHTNIAYTDQTHPHLLNYGTGEVYDLEQPLPGLPGIATPDISPLGDRMVSAVVNNGRYELYTYNLDGSNRLLVASGPFSFAYPEFSPNGQKITYSRIDPATTDYSVWTMDANGNNKQRLTPVTDDSALPTFSPDGTRIAFVRSFNNGVDWQIWVMNTDGSNKKAVTNLPDQDFNNGLEWSPVGDELVAGYVDTVDGALIGRVSLTGNLTPLLPAKPERNASIPTWSPDGNMIAFYNNENGERSLATIPAKGATEPTKLLSSEQGTYPRWGPYLTERRMLGTAALFGANAGGLLFGQDGQFVTSFAAFDATTRAGINVRKQTDSNPTQAVIIASVESADKLTSLKYANSTALPPYTVINPASPATHVSGAAVSFNSDTGKIISVITYNTATSVRAKSGDTTIRGEIVAAWNEQGKNLAPSGASEVVIDASTGKIALQK